MLLSVFRRQLPNLPMCPTEDNDPPATSALAKLRLEIKQCEAFIALCDKIKQLERREERNELPLRKAAIETKRSEFLAQLQDVLHEVQRYELLLRATDRRIGVEEREHLEQLIKSGRTRAKSLQIFADEATEQIRRIDEEAANNARLAGELYAELESQMLSAALHPNTAQTRVAELRREKDLLTEAIRANRPKPATDSLRSEEKGHAVIMPLDGVPVKESDFLRYLSHDLENAGRSVEIMSPFMDGQRAAELMPKLLKLAAEGRNIMLHTRPADEQSEVIASECQQIITAAHRSRITVFQRSGMGHNAVIIDNNIAWEGTVNILGPALPQATMRRVVGSANARELRRFVLSSL